MFDTHTEAIHHLLDSVEELEAVTDHHANTLDHILEGLRGLFDIVVAQKAVNDALHERLLRLESKPDPFQVIGDSNAAR